MYCFQQKLKHFKQQVRKWNKEVFGNIFQERKMLEQKLENLQGQIIQAGYTITQQQEENELKRKLEERHKQEEICGDRNLGFNGSMRERKTPNSSTVP
jgi:RNA polymerase-binding transcription factor DksA